MGNDKGKRQLARRATFAAVGLALAVVSGWLFFGTTAPEQPEAPAEEFFDWPEETTVEAEEAEARTPEPADNIETEQPEEPSEPLEETPAEEPAEERAETRTAPRQPSMPGQSRKRKEYKPSVLRVVTNFDKADVTVNGLPYPEYSEQSSEKGMVLPAGGPYTVEVTYDGKTKSYELSLRPYEVRYLMVELSGFQGGGPVRPTRNVPTGDSARSGNQQDKNEDGNGRVTVYSKPKGTIIVDGNPKKQQTPGTVQVSAGQHNVQVEFEGGEKSESKTVRVRKGSRIKLFFRKRD